MLVVVVGAEVVRDVLFGVVACDMKYNVSREWLERREQVFDVKGSEGSGGVERGEKFSAAFVNECDHIAVVV